MLPYLNPSMSQVRAYELPEIHGPQVIRLHQNEGYFWGKEHWDVSHTDATTESSPLKDMSVYPSLKLEKLRVTLENYYDLPTQCLEITSGSSQALSLLAMMCFGPGKRVAIMDPTFSLYRELVQIYGAKAVDIPLNPSMELSPDALFNPAVLSAHVVILCSPNNPTGTTVPLEWMERLLVENPNRLLVVDEAYIEFQEGYDLRKPKETPSAMSLLKKHSNLLVLRTLSKAWCCANGRIGIAVGNERFIALLAALKPPYSISSHSEWAAQRVLTDGFDTVLKQVHQIQKSRRELEEWISQHSDVYFYPSQANFVTFISPRNEKLFRFLTQNQILVRYFGSKGPMENHIRVSVAEPWKMERFIQKCKEFWNDN